MNTNSVGKKSDFNIESVLVTSGQLYFVAGGKSNKSNHQIKDVNEAALNKSNHTFMLKHWGFFLDFRF